MKRLIALIIALTALFSFAAAETTEAATLTFADLMPEEELALGTYDTLNEDIPAKIWVPNGVFTVADVSEIPEEYATGMEIGVFKFAADESLKVIFFELPNDDGTFDALVESLKAEPESFSSVEEVVVNGIRAVSYDGKDENGETLKYATYEVADYVWLNLMFKATDNAEFNQAVALIAASVIPAE